MGPEHRTKIKNSKILSELIKFATGDETCVIDSAQAQVGLGLLRKVMPDLTENMIKGAEADGSIGITFKTIIEK